MAVDRMPQPAVHILPTSQLLTRYTLIDVLGKGRYGTVWRCRDRVTGRLLACKHIALGAFDSRAWKVALREIDVLALLQGSPHVLSLEAAFGDLSSLYLVTELGGGGDLLTRIEQHGRLTEADARHVFTSVARGVKDCHDRRVIHRDVKLENVLLCCPSDLLPYDRLPLPHSERPCTHAEAMHACRLEKAEPAAAEAACVQQLTEFVPKLADFGLAIRLPAGQQVVGYAGSFPYEAPEVLARAPYDESADVWSLGVLLFAMLSGAWPSFASRGGERWLEEADLQAACWRGVSEGAKALIVRMMAGEAHLRPTAEEVLADPWVAGTCLRRDTREYAKMDAGETRPRGEVGSGGVTVAEPPLVGSASEGCLPGCGKQRRSEGNGVAGQGKEQCVESRAWADLVCPMRPLESPVPTPHAPHAPCEQSRSLLVSGDAAAAAAVLGMGGCHSVPCFETRGGLVEAR